MCLVKFQRHIMLYSELDLLSWWLVDFGYLIVNASCECNLIRTLDKTISNLEMELAAARATQESIMDGSPVSNSSGKRKYLMVVGINTAFSSRKRRDSVRATWMPTG